MNKLASSTKLFLIILWALNICLFQLSSQSIADEKDVITGLMFDVN